MNQPLPTPKADSHNFGNANEFPGIKGKTDEIDALMIRILNDDDYKAFQTLFLKSYEPLCQFCVKFVHVKEVAEELVSDVFYTIWKNRKQLIVSSPRAYLFTAVRNRGFDYLRKIKKSVWCNLEEATHITSDYLDSQELMVQGELYQTLERSIATLPKKCRLVFELSRDYGMKYKEIATMLNISIKTVETQMGRALRHLRQSFPGE